MTNHYINIFGYNCVIMGVCLEVPDFSINFFVILINFHFAQASMIIKVDNKVIDSLKRLYLNEFKFENKLFISL